MLRISAHRRFGGAQAVALLLPLIAVPAVFGQAKYTYSHSVLGTYGGHLALDNDCLSIMPVLTSGDFFDGLQWLKTKSGQDEFRKNGQRVLFFPNSVDISLAVTISPCRLDAPGKPTADKLTNLCNSLVFEASWKEPLETQSSAVLTHFEMIKGPFTHAELLSAIGISKGPLAPPGQYPGYGAVLRASLASAGIPLTNHLVISIFSPEHKFLTRAVVGLTPPPFHVPPKP